MRVIGGTRRGRTLHAPGGGVRPTSDRVREAIFDILGSMVDIDGAEVLDLFAGSGALGIEALSRGASRAVFVDQSRPAVRSLEANLAAAGFRSSALVVKADALKWLARPGAGRFDLAFVDPPYSFSAWERLLDSLDAELAVLESDRPLVVPAGYEVMRNKRYGGTLITVVRTLS